MIINPYKLTTITDGDAWNLCRAMTTPPTAARAALIQTTIASLKSHGIWAKLACLQVYAAANQAQAVVDWLTPTRIAVEHGSLTFTADRGYTGDASAAYVDTLLDPNVTSPYALNDAHLGGWCLGGTDSTTSYLYGQGGGSSARRWLIPNQGTGIIQSRCNAASTGQMVGLTGNAGFYLESRTGSATNAIYKNGAKQIGLTVASSSITDDVVTICRQASTYSDRQCAMFTAGSGLIDQNVTDFYNDMLYYMQQVGAA